MLRKMFLVLSLVLLVIFSSVNSGFAQEGDAVVQGSMQPNWTYISEFTNVFSVNEYGLASVESLLFASGVGCYDLPLISFT